MSEGGALAALAGPARRALAASPVIAVGLGPAPIPGLAALGVRVAGVISAIPAGGAPAPAGAAGLLWLRGRGRDIFAHVVDGFARTLAGARGEIGRFLGEVDPAGEAIVLSYLPVPKDIFGGRRIAAQDAALSRALEDKRSPLLAEALPGPPSVSRRWPCDHASWRAIERALGSTRLVVQALGLAGGGAGTRIVDGHDDAVARLDALAGEVRIAAFVDGDACNVMGLVPPRGPVIALPPTLQVIAVDGEGCPVYAGNRLEWGDFDGGERAAIADEVRGLGERLRGLGFVGPFGLDFLRARDGRRLYHDLNPRMNGAVGLLDEVIAAVYGAPSPLIPLLLAGASLTAEEAAAIEARVGLACRERPRWRLFLSTRARGSGRIEVAPPAGLWAIDAGSLAARWEAAEGPIAAGLGRLRPTLAPGAEIVEGDRVVVGELSCDPALGRALLAVHGASAPERLARALLPTDDGPRALGPGRGRA